MDMKIIERANKIKKATEESWVSMIEDPVLRQTIEQTGRKKLYLKYREIAEKEAEDEIMMCTGQSPLSIGTKIKICEEGEAFGIITGRTRFDEDTFGQGWYVYNVLCENGKCFCLYPHEFTVEDREPRMFVIITSHDFDEETEAVIKETLEDARHEMEKDIDRERQMDEENGYEIIRSLVSDMDGELTSKGPTGQCYTSLWKILGI